MNMYKKIILTSLLLVQNQMSTYAMEAVMANTVTPRISYFCPKMTDLLYGWGVNSIQVELDEKKFTTNEWKCYEKNGRRHQLYLNGHEVKEVELNCYNPVELTVYIMTGYFYNANGTAEHFDPIKLTLNKEKITPNLEAIRITNSPHDITEMKVMYKYIP